LVANSAANQRSYAKRNQRSQHNQRSYAKHNQRSYALGSAPKFDSLIEDTPEIHHSVQENTD
jgi:hypothetical protein